MLGILEGEVLGSVSGFRVVRGDFGVDLVVEREAMMVEVWPRLGGELGEVLRAVGCSGSSEKEEEEGGSISVEEGGSSGWLLLSALLALSRTTKRAAKKEWRGSFNRC